MSLLLITLNAVADKLTTPTYTRDIVETLPRFFNVDAPGGVLHFATAGQLGTADISSLLWAKGRILQMQPGSVPPAGFTKIGTGQTKLYDNSGHPSEVIWDVYQKN